MKVVNRQCKVESISFAIPSADSPPPHFPYLVTHFTDAMPISSIGGALSDILFNPKYAGCVWKIAVAVDHLGNILWICPVLPGTSADVKIWDTVITGAVRALCTRFARAVRKRPLWAFLLFDNGYFDASFTFGIWYIWILTRFHQFSSIFCSFPPHPLLTRLTSPHHGDLKKAGVM